MSTVMPQSEGLKRAVKWISAHLQDDPNRDVLQLTQEAILRFDLSPKDELFLLNFYRQAEGE